MSTNLVPEEQEQWAAVGFAPEEAGAWCEEGFDDPAVAWAFHEAGFALVQAAEWHQEDMTAEDAKRWRGPIGRALMKNRWYVSECEIARVARLAKMARLSPEQVLLLQGVDVLELIADRIQLLANRLEAER